MIKRRLLVALVMVVAMAPGTEATAQAYPGKPIRMIFGSSPGSATDLVSRVYAEQASKHLGVPIVVEARPGGGGVVAARLGASADPDGYTILFITSGVMTYPATVKNLGIDMKTAFAPIIHLSTGSFVLAASPKLPVKNLRELVAHAKANPGKLNYGSSSSLYTLLHAQLESRAGVLDVVPVMYKGAGDVLIAVLSGQVHYGYFSAQLISQQIERGALVAIAATGSARNPVLPNVPTISEEAYPGFDFSFWDAVVAPRQTPPVIQDALWTAFYTGAQAPVVKESTRLGGKVATLMKRDEFARYYLRELDQTTELALRVGLKPE